MIGGRFKNTSVALAAAAGMFVGGTALTPAMAADLGGDCCADLEERVAELEATTVRKGNRKVSLKLSGHVNQAVLYYDVDSSVANESDVYVIDNNFNSGSRFRLTGSAAIKPGWSAGFNIELGLYQAGGGAVGPLDVDDTADVVQIRQLKWYLSTPMGKITVGQGSEATDGITEIHLGGTFTTAYANAAVVNLGNFGMNGIVSADGGRINNVRYDTPTFAGFTASASWGEDDRWGAALRYAGEFNGLRVAAGVGYTWTNDEAAPDTSSEGIGASASVWHVPTGIFVTGAYSTIESNTAGVQLTDGESWYAMVGLRRRFVALGQTAIFVDYGTSGADTLTAAGAVAAENNSNYWGVGLVQWVDAAAMEMYIGARFYEDDDVIGGIDTDELTTVVAGARIKF